MSDRPIPRSWNDRTLWLLEHLLGLEAGGTGLDLPVGSPASQVVHRHRLALTGGGTATETTVQLPTTTRAWWLAGMHFVRTGGSAATYAPRLGQVAAFAAGGIEQRVQYATRIVASPINDVFCAPVPFVTDTTFRLYLRAGWDAGAGNTADVELWWVQSFRTPEST